MSKLDKFEYDFARHIFNGTAITNFSATAGTTSLWLALCTSDPFDEGSTAAEGGYAQYTRVKTDRSSAASTGWAVTSGTSAAAASVSPVATIAFPQNTSTSTGTFTHAVVYPSSDAQSSSGIYGGTITPNINFSQNVTPQITTGSSITET